MQKSISLEEFQRLPTEGVARLVREAGTKVCVFPFNGSRRWVLLEYPQEAATDFMKAYLQRGGRQFVKLCKMLFDHGIETILAPTFGPELMERGEEYVQLMVQAFLWFSQEDDLVNFYDAYDVRVRVYGDTRRHFEDTPYAYVLEIFDQLAHRTTTHQRHRLFFGICANDATETVAEIGAHFYEENGYLPNRRQIVETYYGEYVEPVDIFIGFDRPAAFDMPLIATGCEDLYFMVSPSLYLDVHTLRAILYDHLFARHVDEASYNELSPEDWQTMAKFYALNRQHVLGLGRRHASGYFWYPLPQVELPPRLKEKL
jgi:tuberculosinol/isotuberculosinol synthase